jgi:hypothetical protein
MHCYVHRNQHWTSSCQEYQNMHCYVHRNQHWTNPEPQESPGILNIYKTQRFGNLDLLPSSGDGREPPTVLGPLQRGNLNHWA